MALGRGPLIIQLICSGRQTHLTNCFNLLRHHKYSCAGSYLAGPHFTFSSHISNCSSQRPESAKNKCDNTPSNSDNVQQKSKVKSRGTMKVWQVHDYNGVESLQLSRTAQIPAVLQPDDILVEIHAASINPIDVLMTRGYGSKMLNVLRKQLKTWSTGSEFPLVLGRDFSGVVIETGRSVKKYKVGDEIWGTLGPERQGSHAEFAITSEKEISKKPVSVSHTEAAAVPYVAATSWAALHFVGELSQQNTQGKRVLIHAGAGGIGSFSIQLMKAWGADVTAICSTDSVDFVKSLGADHIIDYKTQDPALEMSTIEKFDFILDPLGKEKTGYSMEFLSSWRNAKFVSIASPLLPSIDKHGLLPGAVMWGIDLGLDILKGFQSGKNYRIAFFLPNSKAMHTVSGLVDEGYIKPVVEKVFPFDQLPYAYEKVGQLKGRGKTVVSMK